MPIDSSQLFTHLSLSFSQSVSLLPLTNSNDLYVTYRNFDDPIHCITQDELNGTSSDWNLK